MDPIYRVRRTVQDCEMDGLGHASNIAYVGWLQEAAVAHSTAVGLGPAEYDELGFAWVVRRHEIEYLEPVRAGEEIEVWTWVATLEKVTSTRRYEIRRRPGPRVIARAATQWVFIDRRRGRPKRIPPEVKDRFRVVPGGPDETTTGDSNP